MYGQLGHDGPATFPWTENYLTGEAIERCPIRQLQLAPPELREEVLRWKNTHFPLFKKGRLLVRGEINDQPARWLAAMLYLEQLSARMERKHVELKLAEQNDGAS
ncbi:MAG: hypothetical protein WEA80_01875 [Gemmatimonadaceae bacterium]